MTLFPHWNPLAVTQGVSLEVVFQGALGPPRWARRRGAAPLPPAGSGATSGGAGAAPAGAVLCPVGRAQGPALASPPP